MFKNKPVIGILATSNYLLTEDSFKDTYRYGNNYIKRIVDNGGIPLLIPFYDNNIIQETLDMCDGLLLPGGEKVLDVNFDVIDYFYKNNKPILGICLGMQTLGMYSIREKRIIKKIDSYINHRHNENYRDNYSYIHDVKIDKDSKLYKIFNKEVFKVNSIHSYCISEVGKEFRVSALSEDNIIEGIEAINKEFVIGIQWHPEIMNEFNNIFKLFVLACKK
jgi:putative glutamine amidotransferase